MGGRRDPGGDTRGYGGSDDHDRGAAEGSGGDQRGHGGSGGVHGM